MQASRILGPAAFLAALTFLPGCFDSGDSPTAGSTDDLEQEAIEYVALEEEADFADPDVFLWEGPDAAPAPFATERWYRELLDLDRTLSIVIEKPDGGPWTADVTIEGVATGLLHLYSADGDSLAHVTKDFTNTGVRSLLFRKERPDGPRHRGWRLVALSGVLIESPATTRRIESVRIQAAGVDETITNVTELQRVQDVLALPPNTEATVTVTTGDASDQVFLHLRRCRMRIPLVANGDGTFSGRFLTGGEFRPHHLVVDVLSEGTLYDDVAPYDNIAWGIPWRAAVPAPGES
jgi:hypothetical protein